MEIPPTQLHWVASSTRSQPHRKQFVTSTPKRWGNLFGYTTLKRIFMGRSGKDRLRLNMISEIGLPTIILNIKGEDANRCVAQEVKLPSLIYTRLDLRHLAETHKLPGHCYHLRGLHCTWSD